MPTVYKTPDEVYEIDVRSDLRRVLESFDRFKPVIDFGLVIDLLLAYNDDGDPVKHHGAPALATIKVIGPKERARGQGDVLIEIDAKAYQDRPQRRRDAILCHELYHVQIKTHPAIERDDQGKERIVIRPDLDPYERPVVRLIPDDWVITGFRTVAEWYGQDSAEVQSYYALGERLAQGVLPFVAAPIDPATLPSLSPPADATPPPAVGPPTAPDAGGGAPDEVDRRPIRGETNDLLDEAFGDAEDEQWSPPDPDAAHLRNLPVVPLKVLNLDPGVIRALVARELGTLATLGRAMADTTDADGFDPKAFGIRNGLTTAEAAQVWAALLAYGRPGPVESDPSKYPVQEDAGTYQPPAAKPKRARKPKAEGARP